MFFGHFLTLGHYVLVRIYASALLRLGLLVLVRIFALVCL